MSGGRPRSQLCVALTPGDAARCRHFHQFARTVLGWSFAPQGYAGINVSTIPPELLVPLLEYGETLAPDLAVRELDPSPNATPWQVLITLLPTGQAFERVTRGHGRLEASAHGRMERLLRQSGVSAGLLFNGAALRLISAPRGENSGWLDFRVAEMVQTAGRPIIAALRLLLHEQRLLALPRSERLAALLDESRKFQNEVSERLAEQKLSEKGWLRPLVQRTGLCGLGARASRPRERVEGETPSLPDSFAEGLFRQPLRAGFRCRVSCRQAVRRLSAASPHSE